MAAVTSADLVVRSETVADYGAIAEVNALAFAPLLRDPAHNPFVAEFAIVDAQRHAPRFDPDLSLVAVADGRVVGHALFYPCHTWVDGQALVAVYLAPLAVRPEWQRRGIGGALLEEGHRRARARGAAYAYLLGHADYYPRFGYRTHAFGQCQLLARASNLTAGSADLVARPVAPADLTWLCALWRRWYADVDLAVMPEPALMEWVTHSAAIVSVVLWRGEEHVGYLRYPREDPVQLKLALAPDGEALGALLGYLCSQGVGPEAVLRLPLHPDAAAVRQGLPFPYTAAVQAWDAGMIKVLDPSARPIVDYLDAVLQGTRTPGLVLWPPYIEFC